MVRLLWIILGVRCFETRGITEQLNTYYCFRKVLRQQISGEVVVLISTSSAVPFWI